MPALSFCCLAEVPVPAISQNQSCTRKPRVPAIRLRGVFWQAGTGASHEENESDFSELRPVWNTQFIGLHQRTSSGLMSYRFGVQVSGNFERE